MFDIILPCLTWNPSDHAVLNTGPINTELHEPGLVETNVRESSNLASVRDRQQPFELPALLLIARHEFWLVLALTTAGAILRVFQLGTQSLWYDELFSVAIARGNWLQIIAGTVQADVHPPLYYLLLHAVLQLGSDEIAARVLSCLFSIASIPLFYVVARSWFDGRVALLATGILAVSPLHVLFAQEARMYAQLTFFILLALFFLERSLQHGRAYNWVLFGGAVTASLYTHNLASLYLLALDGVALVQWRRLRPQFRLFLFAHSLLGLAFLPWLPSLLQQLIRVRNGFWGTTPSLLNVLATPHLLLFGTAVPLLMVPFALFAGLALIAFALRAGVHAVRTRQPSAPGLASVAAIFLVPLLALFVLSLLGTIYVERVLLPASLGLYGLLAWTLLRAPPRALNLGLGAVALLAMCSSHYSYYFDPSVQKPHLREAAQALAGALEPGDVIAHTSDSSALAFAYYAPNLPSHFLAGDPDFEHETERATADRYVGLAPEALERIVANHTRLWLVVALDHNEEYQRSWVAQFDARYSRASSRSVLGINLFLYRLTDVSAGGNRLQGATGRLTSQRLYLSQPEEWAYSGPYPPGRRRSWRPM